MKKWVLRVIGVGAAITALAVGLLWYAVRAPARAVQNEKTTPKGLHVSMVGLTDDPTIVTIDTDQVAKDQLKTFAGNLCRHSAARIETLHSNFIQRMHGRKTALIFCWE